MESWTKTSAAVASAWQVDSGAWLAMRRCGNADADDRGQAMADRRCIDRQRQACSVNSELEMSF